MVITIIDFSILVIASVFFVFSFKQPYDKKSFLDSNNATFVQLFLGIILTIGLGKEFSLITLAAGISLFLNYRSKGK